MRILTITGPTACGKTAVALELARLIPIEIVSADSRQVYRRLDIGTAKPTRAELAVVPHHGIDVVEPTERYSGGRFARDATASVAATQGRGRLPVIVGGTGFYLRALFEGLFAEPDLGDDERRSDLQAVLSELPSNALMKWARRLDAGFTDTGNRQRAMRAIEVAVLSGTPLSVLHRQAPAPMPGLKPFYVRLDIPRGMLDERIRARTRAMFDAGLVDEVRRALASGVPKDAPGLTGVGYREVIDGLAAGATRQAMEEAIVLSTRRYAKRQVTWFRHQLPEAVTAVDATRPAELVAREVLSGYRAAAPEGD